MKKIIEESINKKGLSLLTLILFVVFTFSCQSIRPTRVETTTFKNGKIVKVYQLQKKSGERIRFAKDDPAVIIDGKVKGEILNDNGQIETVSIPLSDVELVWTKRTDAGKTVLGIGAGIGGYIVVTAVLGALLLAVALSKI